MKKTLILFSLVAAAVLSAGEQKTLDGAAGAKFGSTTQEKLTDVTAKDNADFAGARQLVKKADAKTLFREIIFYYTPVGGKLFAIELKSDFKSFDRIFTLLQEKYGESSRMLRRMGNESGPDSVRRWVYGRRDFDNGKIIVTGESILAESGNRNYLSIYYISDEYSGEFVNERGKSAEQLKQEAEKKRIAQEKQAEAAKQAESERKANLDLL